MKGFDKLTVYPIFLILLTIFAWFLEVEGNCNMMQIGVGCKLWLFSSSYIKYIYIKKVEIQCLTSLNMTNIIHQDVHLWAVLKEISINMSWNCVLFHLFFQTFDFCRIILDCHNSVRFGSALYHKQDLIKLMFAALPCRYARVGAISAESVCGYVEEEKTRTDHTFFVFAKTGTGTHSVCWILLFFSRLSSCQWKKSTAQNQFLSLRVFSGGTLEGDVMD